VPGVLDPDRESTTLPAASTGILSCAGRNWAERRGIGIGIKTGRHGGINSGGGGDDAVGGASKRTKSKGNGADCVFKMLRGTG
jgi:hypothetical protein